MRLQHHPIINYKPDVALMLGMSTLVVSDTASAGLQTVDPPIVLCMHEARSEILGSEDSTHYFAASGLKDHTVLKLKANGYHPT